MLPELLAVGFLIGSYHDCRDCGYHERNPGVFVEMENVTASLHTDSYNRLGAGVYYTTRYAVSEGFAVGALAGLQIGHKYPVGGGVFADMGFFKILAIPGVRKENKWTIAVGVRFPL